NWTSECRGRARLGDAAGGNLLPHVRIQPARADGAAMPRMWLSLRLERPARRAKPPASISFRTSPRAKFQIFLADGMGRLAPLEILEHIACRTTIKAGASADLLDWSDVPGITRLGGRAVYFRMRCFDVVPANAARGIQTRLDHA